MAPLQTMRIGRSLTSEFNHLVASINASIRVKGRKCRNINLLSIAYAYPPRLRSRLTPGRKTWPGNPWVYGGRGFHPPYRYSCLHPLLSALHFQSPSSFNVLTMLLYRSPVHHRQAQSFGIVLNRQSFSAQSLSMSKLLRIF